MQFHEEYATNALILFPEKVEGTNKPTAKKFLCKDARKREKNRSKRVANDVTDNTQTNNQTETSFGRGQSAAITHSPSTVVTKYKKNQS